MSASTSTDNSALNDHLVTGETLFVSGAVLAFVAEVASTFRTLVSGNTFGLLLGIVFVLVTMYFIQAVYSGKKEARTTAMIWALAQIAIALVGTLLLLNLDYRLWDYRLYPVARWLPQSLSVSSWGVGIFKVIGYSAFAYVICQRGPALFFLRHKGGETLEPPSPTGPPEDVKPSGQVLALSADQTDTADSLSTIMQYAGNALMIAGFLIAVVGGQTIASNTGRGWLTLGEGVAILAFGLFATTPVGSLRNIKDRGADTAYITDALSKLAGAFEKQVVFAAALAVLLVAGIVLTWM